MILDIQLFSFRSVQVHYSYIHTELHMSSRIPIIYVCFQYRRQIVKIHLDELLRHEVDLTPKVNIGKPPFVC